MAWKNGESAINTHRTSNGRKKARKKPKRRLPPEVLSPEEIAAMMDACSDTPAGIRNRALITVLYRAGLRINEALELRPKDLDPRNGAIRVLFAKGGRSRTVGMDGQAFEAIGQWLEIRAAHGIHGRARVFCLLDGRPPRDRHIRLPFPRAGPPPHSTRPPPPNSTRGTDSPMCSCTAARLTRRFRASVSTVIRSIPA